MHKRLIALTSGVVLTFGLIALPAAAQASSSAASSSKTGTVVVQLVGPSGKPLVLKKSAVVTLGSAATDYSIAEATFNSHGVATVTHVRAGTTVVQAFVPGQQIYAFTQKTIAVKSGKKITVKISGSVGATISGTVRADSSSGRLVDNSMVTAIPVTGGTYRPSWAYTDRQGNYTITGLNSGTYKLSFGVPVGAPALANYVGNWWKGSPNAAGGQTITVRQQSATTPAAVTTKVNDVLSIGHRLTVLLDSATAASFGEFASVTFEAVRGTSDLDTTFADADNGSDDELATSYSQLLGPGTFIVELSGEHTRYYAGEGKPFTADRTKAAVVSFNGKADRTIHFGTAH